MKTGWERENRTHFDEITASYDKIRPEYPRELFADIFDYAGASTKALEIGAGTGKATAAFLGAGYDVTAVEIGENMAAFLRDRFDGNSGFRVIVSAFEDAVLEDGAYDLVYAASAFHWVDAEIGCPKAFRLLKKGGVLALFKYNYSIIPVEDEELFGEIQAVYERHFNDYYASNKSPVKITHELLLSPRKIKSGYGFEDMAAYGFADVTMKLYDAVLSYNTDEYIAFLDTIADHRALPDDNRAALYAGIKEILNKHGGCRKIDCTFQLYMGRRM